MLGTDHDPATSEDLDFLSFTCQIDPSPRIDAMLADRTDLDFKASRATVL